MQNVAEILKSYLPENFRDTPLFAKARELLEYVILNFNKDFSAVQDKNLVLQDDDAIRAKITELGFSYILSVSDTITNTDKELLVNFIAALNALKGSRTGLEIILQLLGFDAIIVEWWEREPFADPYTYDMTVIIKDAIVPDMYKLFLELKNFSKSYIYPVIRNLDYRYTLTFAEPSIISYGYNKQTVSGLILQRG